MDILEIRKQMRAKADTEQAAPSGNTRRPRRASTFASPQTPPEARTEPRTEIRTETRVAISTFGQTFARILGPTLALISASIEGSLKTGFKGFKRAALTGPETAAAEKSHTGTKGLYGHIQDNNKKSMTFLAGFLFVILYIQFSIMSFFVPLNQGPNYEGTIIDWQIPDLAQPLGNNVGNGGLKTVDIGDRASGSKNKSNKAWAHRHGEGTNIFMATLKDLGILFSVLILNGRVLEGWIFGLLPALIYVLERLWFASYFVKRQTGARRIAQFDEPRLYRLVETLTRARGLPMPALEIIECTGRNAYAGGLTPANSVIGVTRGLLDALNDAELEAVLAHEIAHIEARDNRLMTISNLCTDYASYYVDGWNNAENKISIRFYLLIAIPLVIFAIAASAISLAPVLIVVGIVILPWLMSRALNSLISQKREYMADARAIEIMKSPAALISALQKIARNDHIDGLSRNVQAMLISNLSGGGDDTHPSIVDRIRAIEETTTVNAADIAAIANGPHGDNGINARHETGLTAATANTEFGRRPIEREDLQSGRVTSNEKPVLEDQSKERLYNILMNIQKATTSLNGSSVNRFIILWSAFILCAVIFWMMPFLSYLASSPVILVGISLAGLVFWRATASHP